MFPSPARPGRERRESHWPEQHCRGWNIRRWTAGVAHRYAPLLRPPGVRRRQRTAAGNRACYHQAPHPGLFAVFCLPAPITSAAWGGGGEAQAPGRGQTTGVAHGYAPLLDSLGSRRPWVTTLPRAEGGKLCGQRERLRRRIEFYPISVLVGGGGCG